MPIGDPHKANAGRNYALAGALIFFVSLIFVITLVKLDVI